MVTTFRSRSRRPGAVSVKKSLGQRRGVERARVGREDNHAKSASAQRAPWAVGRFSTGRSARGPRATGVERCGYDVSKPQPPTWRGVGEEEPQPTAWGGARRALAAKTTTPSPPARACSVGGRPVLHGAKRARAARHGSRKRGHDVPKPQPPTWRGVGEEEPRPTAWGGARRALAAKTTTPSPPARACSVGGRPVLHGAKRARAARHGNQTLWSRRSKPQPPTWRGVGEEEPRPTAWGGARRALAAKTTTPSPPARACSVGGRLVLHGAKRARAARHGIESVATTSRSRSRRPGAVSVKRASANGVGWSAPRVGREDNHAKSASARVLRGRSAGSPRGEARAGRAPRESKLWSRRSKPQPPTWRGVGEEEPRPTAWGGARSRVGREDNHAKSASARVLRGRSAGSPRAKRARAARHGSRTRWSRRFEAAAADLARCR